MTPIEQQRAFLNRLGHLKATSVRRFEILRQAEKVTGDFSASLWMYAGRNLRFVLRARSRSALQRGPDALPGIVGTLARCFVVASIERRLSPEAVYGRLQGVRWLVDVTGSGVESWLALSPASLNRVIANLRRECSEATTYNRVGAVSAFIDFLNRTQIGSSEGASTLLGRHISWSPGVRNPIHRSIEIDDADVDAAGQRKYVPDLHRALGQARSNIRLNPELEPSPGYDLIRLESLAFVMATGMRVGELCALSVRCLDTHEASGTTFVRVATEKGQPPSARPIAKLWHTAVSDAYDYLLERCSDARARAKEIDTHGFAFVVARLLDARCEHPIGAQFHAQLDVLGLEPDQHFQIAELLRVFDLSQKEFCSDGRFQQCMVTLPRIVAARVVRWMDARVANWDWQRYSVARPDARTAQVGSRSLSATQIAHYIGGGRACLPKARWFYPELRSFLVELSRAGALEGRAMGAGKIEELRHRWLAVRQKALAKNGGAQCTAVDIEKFTSALAARHQAHLEEHYKDLIVYDDKGVPTTGDGVRAGVPDRLSDHLIVVWEGEFSGRGRKGILPRPVFRSDFYNYLSSNAQKKTVFERLRILDQAGKPYSITPHQIRHWVTTAIFRSGPSEMMVDLWMGRAPGQSRIYDHRTARERAEVIRARYLSGDPPDDYLGRQVRFWTGSGLSKAELEERIKSRLRVLHFVPTGGCSRELFTKPCTKGLMCLKGFGTGGACPSFHIDVSDEKARAHIVTLRGQYRAMLAALYPMATSLEEAFKEELNSTEVLDQHVMHIREVLRGCDQALEAYERAKSRSADAAKIIPIGVSTR